MGASESKNDGIFNCCEPETETDTIKNTRLVVEYGISENYLIEDFSNKY